jgi:hypothetical protein
MHLSARAMTVLLGSAVLAAPTFAQARPFGYTPGTQRYRVTTITHNQRDQTGGRAPMEYEYTTTQMLTVALAPKGNSRDSLALTITVDSIDVSSTDMDTQKPDLTWARGAKLVGTLSRTGKLYDLAPSEGSSPNLLALAAGFRHFFVAFPSPALHVGTTWADTVRDQVRNRSSFDSVLTETIASYKIAGDTTFAGQPVWRIERTSTISIAGDGKEGGQPLHMDGDGSIRSVQFVNPAGVYLGSKSTQTLRIVESFKETGEGAPQTQTIKSTIEPVPPVRTADAGL